MTYGVSQQFRDLVEISDESVQLARAALQVARIQYPAVDVDDYVGRIDQMAAVVGSRLDACATTEDTLRAINRHLFLELKFSGNNEEYYDPRNSYLNEVIERRVGIPITLSIIYLEVGWRLDLPLVGVSFPGHFLVKLPVEEGEIVLDPFASGISLGHEELEMRLLGMTTPNRPPGQLDVAQYLEAAPRKEILHRMLRNLKSIHMNNNDDDKALAIIEHMLCVRPDDVAAVRDRGLVYARLGCSRLAVDDLNRYLIARPDADDVEEVREHLVDARRAATRLH
jgi:regulator of sirC expression with transglutaminase-like and TPR domain